MRLPNTHSISFALILALLFLLTVTYSSLKKGVSPSPSLALDAWQYWKSAVKMSMNQTHVFVPANHPYIYYVGRWVPSANHLRRDAGFPGSYFEAIVTNTTSIYVVLNNVYVPRHAANPASAYKEVIHSRRWELHSQAKRTWAAQQVNLIAEIEGEGVQGFEEASNILHIAQKLDPQKTYRLKVTHMGSYPIGGLFNAFDGGVFQFEGLWLDSPASAPGTIPKTNATGKRTLGELRPLAESRRNLAQTQTPTASGKNAIIELVTSERPVLHSQLKDPHKDSETSIQERISTWYHLLGLRLSADVAMVPTERSRLVATDITQVTIHNLFFRPGPEGSTHLLPRPWSFGTYQPDVLVLQFGLADYLHAYKNPDHAVRHKFANDFADTYVTFVKAIRSNAYPLPMTSSPMGSFDATDDDGSYVYNSAPSTLPIFLMAPFSSRRHFVTTSLTMHKVISDALNAVAWKLHMDGDRSTHFIDTTGWLDPKNDFDQPHGNRNSSLDVEVLAPAANDRVASLLADHICPYLEGYPDRSTEGPALGCAFDRYESYLGNVYVPNDVELDRALLERKIEDIKGRFKAEQDPGP